MPKIEPASFHKLYGLKGTRTRYQKKDFVDYTLMILISVFIIYFSYGPTLLLSKVAFALCAFMVVVFPIRHGFEFKKPVMLKRPQDLWYMIVYKIQNIKGPYLFAVSLLLLENYLIILTPDLPHKVELMNEVAINLFYFHFILVSTYRTASLISHLYKKELVREVLMQSTWKGLISKQPNITLEILHAYFTGLLTHIILIAPWYIVITYFNFSIIFLPAIVIVNSITYFRFAIVINAWVYRDHWLGHNSELEFIYLHGSHHDAIPSGLIGVAGNGFLEGFTRHSLGMPNAFFNPIIAFIYYTSDVVNDITSHQYIPGVFPKVYNKELSQHSMHHYGLLEPYGFAIKIDQPNIPENIVIKLLKKLPDEQRNSIKLDEQLTGFKWDNARFKWYLELVDKYQK